MFPNLRRMSSKFTPYRDALLDEIEAFCATRKMSVTTFGLRAVNDPNIVPQLRGGRDVRLTTVERLQSFMRSSQEAAE